MSHRGEPVRRDPKSPKRRRIDPVPVLAVLIVIVIAVLIVALTVH